MLRRTKHTREEKEGIEGRGRERDREEDKRMSAGEKGRDRVEEKIGGEKKMGDPGGARTSREQGRERYSRYERCSRYASTLCMPTV